MPLETEHQKRCWEHVRQNIHKLHDECEESDGYERVMLGIGYLVSYALGVFGEYWVFQNLVGVVTEQQKVDFGLCTICGQNPPCSQKDLCAGCDAGISSRSKEIENEMQPDK